MSIDRDKLLTMQALYIMAFTSEKSLLPVTVELFHLIGDILEGVPPGELELHNFDHATLLKTIEELTVQEKEHGNDSEIESNQGNTGLEPRVRRGHQRIGDVHQGKRTAATTSRVAGSDSERL